MKRTDFILALEKEQKKKELEEKNILVKNKSFTLNEEQKKIIEDYYNYSFTKKYFSTKNTFLFKAIKEVLEKNNFTFKTEKELEEELEKELEQKKKELELEEQKKKEEEKNEK